MKVRLTPLLSISIAIIIFIPVISTSLNSFLPVYAKPSINIEGIQQCTQRTKDTKGTIIKVTISGVEHDSQTLSYPTQVLSPDGNILQEVDIQIPADAPNPVSTYIGFSLPLLPEGAYTIRAIINGDEITQTADVPAPSCTDAPKPVADAGSPQTVNSGDTVQLDGSKSFDSTGSPLSFSWTQTSGPTVNLNNPTSSKPTFTVPKTTEIVKLNFQLVVSNEEGKTSEPGNVIISVNPISHPPSNSQGDIQKLIDIIHNIVKNTRNNTPSFASLMETIKLLTSDNPNNSQFVCKILNTYIPHISEKQANSIQNTIKC